MKIGNAIRQLVRRTAQCFVRFPHRRLERFCSFQLTARSPEGMWAPRKKPDLWKCPEWMFNAASAAEFHLRGYLYPTSAPRNWNRKSNPTVEGRTAVEDAT